MKKRAYSFEGILIRALLTYAIGFGTAWFIANTRHNTASRNFKYGKMVGEMQAYENKKEWELHRAFYFGYKAAIFLSPEQRKSIAVEWAEGRIKSEQETQDWIWEIESKSDKQEDKIFERIVCPCCKGSGKKKVASSEKKQTN